MHCTLTFTNAAAVLPLDVLDSLNGRPGKVAVPIGDFKQLLWDSILSQLPTLHTLHPLTILRTLYGVLFPLLVWPLYSVAYPPLYRSSAPLSILASIRRFLFSF